MKLRQVSYAGAEYLRHATDLLQSARLRHSTAGVWEAADLQWWWRKPRRTDARDQVFWLDDEGKDVAAAIITGWEDMYGLDVITIPTLRPDQTRMVWGQAIELATQLDAPVVQTIDNANAGLRDHMVEFGFSDTGESGVSAWMDPKDRPGVSELLEGYTLRDRAESADVPHPMIPLNGPRVADRLLETSVYRQDLDLFVVDPSGEPAAYGLFWLDPVTGVGLVEPMRTFDAHRRKGLARHILSAGLDRLTHAGASRLKINYENDNDASKRLYIESGFIPTMSKSVYVRNHN